LTNAEQFAKVIDAPPKPMTTAEAIIEVRNTHSAVTAALHNRADKAALRDARRAYKIAALNLWNAWKSEGHPDKAGEILSAYGICFA
jgi:hypothetical protein